MIAFTEPVAQRAHARRAEGVYSFVDVKAAAGSSDDALRDRVAAALGAATRSRPAQQLADERPRPTSRRSLSFFNYILIGFAFVALFVAVFLILNTFSIIVAQRTRELALMRAIGASRRQVIGSVLLEAVVIGLIASVLGLGGRRRRGRPAGQPLRQLRRRRCNWPAIGVPGGRGHQRVRASASASPCWPR